MSSTEHSSCDFCKCSLSMEPDYIPIGTRRGMTVHVCPSCGLTQSRQGKRDLQRSRTLSTDADWGNVRHGKSARFGALLRILEREIAWVSVRRVADIGANRGDFVLWLNENHPDIESWAIEPDTNIISHYAEIPNLHLHTCRLESLQLPASQFDLIFCSHTLEHADSAAEMLNTLHRALRPGGLLLLDIPNLEGISSNDIIEEFFIDKHSFHFDRETLLDYLPSAGYSVLQGSGDEDVYNVTLLLRRENLNIHYCPTDGVKRAARNRQWLASFTQRLPANRILLQDIVDKKLRPLAKRQKVAYWGAGRIFDALVRYGGLGPQDVYCLVDRHLQGIVEKTHGLKIERPESLLIHEPQVIVVLARSAEELIARSAYSFGIRHVIKFSELLGQVRDVPSRNRDY